MVMAPARVELDTDAHSVKPAAKVLRVVLYSIYYDAASTGIARYSAELAEWLAARGHHVTVITAPPHYPEWRIAPEEARGRWRQKDVNGVDIRQTPLYVPASDRLGTRNRIRYELSFAWNSLFWWLPILVRRQRHDVVIAVCPSLQSAWMPIVYRVLRGVPWVFHVQDLQVDTAFRLGMLGASRVSRLLFQVEARLLRRADAVSTITAAMRRRIVDKGIDPARTVHFPNWADTAAVRPGPRDTGFRRALGIPHDHTVVLYAGNLGEKQGLELVLHAADRLRERSRLRFVIAGAGAARSRLESEAKRLDLPNLHLLPLQPREMLSELLASGDIHLVVQKREAADLVMPSKLTNILAAGRPAIATADPGTELHDVVAHHRVGLVTPPGDLTALVAAIARLDEDVALRTEMGRNARAYAETHLAKDAILFAFEASLGQLVGRRAASIASDESGTREITTR